MPIIPKKMRVLIEQIIDTEEFWMINYYFRSMKKTPHGGVFECKGPNVFLKYYPVKAYEYFKPSIEIPYPLIANVDFFSEIIVDSNINKEEILKYCLCIDSNISDKSQTGNEMYIASCGKIITSPERNDIEHMMAVHDAMDGKINIYENFKVDEERLVILFLLTLIERFQVKICDVNEIEEKENFILEIDKYGLTDVTDADFKRQGFVLNDKYYLYNIFFDTSIGSPLAKVPLIIELFKSLESPLQIMTRCDENLAVPSSEIVSTSTIDFQKWRGITLNFNKINELLKSGKETIVHFDEETLNKVLVYIKRETTQDGEDWYHFNVEQLWNPDNISDSEKIITTNYVHGTYYPSNKAFEHIDFSINQYNREIFEAKYKDAKDLTGIPIEKYADQHYKIWCVRGENLIPEVWSKLVCASLDLPFRSIFMETIGGTYT